MAHGGEDISKRLSFVLLLLILAATTANGSGGKVKNIILVIGDGMGPGQLGLLSAYARQAPNSIYRQRKNSIEEMIASSTLGVMLTPPHNGLVVDSACSATQLSTGRPANSEVIGIDYQGISAPTILELAAKRGMRTGLVTDARITHATPAAFAAHVPSRHMENRIAQQLINSQADLLLGGGARHFIPSNMGAKKFKQQYPSAPFAVKSKRKDQLNLLAEAKKRGLSLAFSKQELEQFKGRKLLGLFSKSGMPDGIEERDNLTDTSRTTPHLAEMAQHALRVLSQDSKKGFFLMVEAGQIDWAGHYNDVGMMLQEMVKLERTIGAIMRWAKGRKDTLVVMTADHETGSFGLSYSLYNIPKASAPIAPQIDPRPYQRNYNYGDPKVLDKIYQQKRSFIGMLKSIKKLPKKERTVDQLHSIIAPNLSFKVTKEDIKTLLVKGKNRYYLPGHWGAGKKKVVKICDFAAYYTSTSKRMGGVLGRMLADQQGVVWGTGAHTATPVLVIAHGPTAATSKFSGLFQTFQVGQRLISLLPGNQ